MLRWSVRLAIFAALLLAGACSGGTGCSGRGTTLPGGFPQADVVPNAASARLTRPGLDFIANNLGSIASSTLGASGDAAQFAVPEASTSLSFFGIQACGSPGAGQCLAQAMLGGAALHVDAVAPDSLSVSGTVPVEAADIPVVASGPFGLRLTFDIGLGSGGCNGGTPRVTPTSVPVAVSIPLVAESQMPRAGYTKIDTANASVSATIDASTLQICGSGISGLFAGVLGDFKSFVLGLVESPLESALRSQLASQLCQKPDPTSSPPCPSGTAPSTDGTECLFGSGTEAGQCLPTLLGTEGHLDLGALLATLSPGTASGIDFVLAAGGDASAAPNCKAGQTWTASSGCATDRSAPYPGHTPNGITLGLLGGALPDPPSSCVSPAPNPLPQGIPIPDELTTDTVTPWPTGDSGPDFGLALAGRFLNYVATSAYNSGALCLGASTDAVQELNTGLVSAILPSVKDLTFEPGPSSPAAAMAIATRPQRPPSITVGGGTDITSDPLLTVLLPQFATDFYVWSYDRYVRVLTYTADLTIPVNLQTGQDPTASVTSPAVGGILPVLGDVSAENASVTNSELLAESPEQISGAVTALLSGLVGELLGKALPPLDVGSALAKFGVNLDIPAGGFRKLTKDSDDFLALFGDLTTGATIAAVHPRASLVGMTVDPAAMALGTADRAQFPTLSIAMSVLPEEDDGTRAIEYSLWIDDQPRSAWQTSPDAEVHGQFLFFQGKHVLRVTARFEGHPETEGTTPAEVPFTIDVLPPTVWIEKTDSGYAGRAYDFVSATPALRARYRTNVDGAWSPWGSLESLPTFPTKSVELEVMDEVGNVGASNGLLPGAQGPTDQAAGASGCSTSGKPARLESGESGESGALAMLGCIAALALLARRRRAAGVLVVAVTQGCSCSGSGNGGSPTGCGDGCDQTCGPPNPLGLIGSYTSYAVAPEGTVWLAGYDDADVTSGLLYGDLVVGTYDVSTHQIAWQTVDGLPPPPPAGSCPPNPPSTWRSGLTDPGPDVGLWTSIQLDSGGNPMVSYYDATNSALKFASSPDGGKTWGSHTVMQAASSDIGRYSKMLILGGVPTVAFLVIEPGSGGWTRSRVVIATAKVTTPQSASDWTFQDAVVDEQTPCQAAPCGDSVAMAKGPNGVGLVIYEHGQGNLVGAVRQGDTWTATVLDGPTGAGTGDVGIGASLAITDDGDWHIGYVNGWTGALQYLRVPGGDLQPLRPEIVDDGTQVGGQPFPDGTHLIGDDCSLTVGDDGTVRIVYQDASAGTLREAIGSAGAAPQTQQNVWTTKVLSQPSFFAGFFPHYIPQAQSIENWYRALDDTRSPPLVTGNVAFVSP